MIGMGGNGKTTKLRLKIRAAARVLVFDPINVLYGEGINFYSRDELTQWIAVNGENERFKVVYHPPCDPADFKAMQLEADWFCWVARNLKNVSIFFDELDLCAEVDKIGNHLNYILNIGRNDSISIYGSVRRPLVKVPRDWMTEANVIYAFQTTDNLDCGKLASKMMVPADEFPKLKQFHYLEWRSGEGVKQCVLQNPYIQR